MGEHPTDTNTAAIVANKFIQSAIFDVALNAFKTWATVQVPFLGWPIIKQIFSLLVGKIGDFIYEYLATIVTFSIIDLKIQAEKNAYDEAVTDLKKAHEGGNPDEVQKAKEEFKKRFRSLIHSNGAAPI